MPVKTTGRVRVAHAEKYPSLHKAESCAPVVFRQHCSGIVFRLDAVIQLCHRRKFVLIHKVHSTPLVVVFWSRETAWRCCDVLDVGLCCVLHRERHGQVDCLWDAGMMFEKEEVSLDHVLEVEMLEMVLLVEGFPLCLVDEALLADQDSFHFFQALRDETILLSTHAFHEISVAA